jgi:hypothetical protein
MLATFLALFGVMFAGCAYVAGFLPLADAFLAVILLGTAAVYSVFSYRP